MYRQDASSKELARQLSADGGTVSFVRQFTSDGIPASWTVLPLSASAGWLTPVTEAITADANGVHETALTLAKA